MERGFAYDLDKETKSIVYVYNKIPSYKAFLLPIEAL